MDTAWQSLDDWIDAAEYFAFRGHRIAAWESGSSRPLLLIHGYPTSSWDWHLVWAELARGHRLVACDMLGFGLSDKPASGYAIHAQADLQEALLARLDVGEFDVLAHDYGVSVAQELLARHNEGSGASGLGRVVFLNGGLFPEQHRMLPIQRLGISPLGFLVGRFMNRKRFGAAFVEVFGARTKPSEAELDDFWRLITHNDGHRLAHRLLHYIGDRRAYRERWVGALQRARVPLKLIDGGADPVSGQHMYRHFERLVPQAEAVCLPDIGHYPQTEAPGRVIEELEAFLRQGRSSAFRPRAGP
jgi:pimeloyl-ACP methyl ester carboxylesterase